MGWKYFRALGANVSDGIEEAKPGFAAKLQSFLMFLASLGIGFLAYAVAMNKIPRSFVNFYAYFYVLSIIGVLGFLGEKISITLLSFLLPVVLAGSTLTMKFKPDSYPIEDWWEVYSVIVLFSSGVIAFLFFRFEQLKKAKGYGGGGGDGGPLKARVDPTSAAKFREEQARKQSAKDPKIDGLKGGEERVAKAKKPEPVAQEVIDPNETPEQRMEREMRTIKDDFSKKSMKLSTTLLRIKNLAKSLDRDEIFATVLEIVSKGMDADRVQLLLNNEKDGNLRVVRAEGMPSKEFKEIVIPHEETSIIAFLCRQGGTGGTGTGGALGVKECDVDPKTRGLIGQGALKTVIAAPIIQEGRVFAIINVEKMKNPDYTRDDQNLLATTADVAGLVMKNAKLYSATMDDLVSTKKLSEEQLKQNEQLKGSLSRIVSPRVAEMIMQDPSALKLGGSKGEVTCFFSDIRGFTKMSEGMDPTAIVEQLNVYFTRMTDILMESDGTLDKYVGDEMMALFGAPVAAPDDPIRAVLCAVRMMDALRELQKVWEKEAKPVIKIGIGINTGEVTAGYMGSEKQLSYTVIGDNVNTASRVMGSAKGMEILITRSTYERVKDYFLITPLDAITVKNKSMPIEVWRVEGIRGDVDLSKVVADTKVLGSMATVGMKTVSAAAKTIPDNLPPEMQKQNIQIDGKPKVIECKSCGTENDMQTKFCSKCGMPVF